MLTATAVEPRSARPAREPDVPPGWDHNPSGWWGKSGRVPVLAVSVFGLLVAAYLTLYQLGVFTTVWEPFFGGGSHAVLHSAVSTLLPVPDASLGALSYALDVIFGAIGGTARWRTAPWIVCAFAAVVLPTSLVSTGLLMVQPILVHQWCTLCMVSALASIVIAGPTLAELLATLQHLKRAWREERGFWRPFWGLEDA